MTRQKMFLFLALGIAGAGAMVVYGASVLPAAPSPFQLAVLVFTGIAAVVGFLGLIVSFVTLRMEAGRVPRPDVAIRGSGGTWSKTLSLDAAFIEPATEFPGEIDERQRSLEHASRVEQPHPLVASFIASNFQSDLGRYERDVENHLKQFQEHLEMKSIWDSFWRRSYVAVFALTNDKAGVPASGIKMSIHFPEEEEGIRIFRLEDLPDRPVEPNRPTPPRPAGVLGYDFRIPNFAPPISRSNFPDLRPPGNVSGPEIGKGSVLVSYTVQELLHNTIETTEDDPVVISFLQPGKWTVPYEVHARNLPTPKKGTLTIEVIESDDAPSYEPIDDVNEEEPTSEEG